MAFKLSPEMITALIGGTALLGGSGFSTLVNAQTNKRAYHHQRDLMELQAKLNYNYQKKMSQWTAQNGATMTRQGLESAGYNPMLAFNGGNFMQAGGTFTAGGAAPQQAPVDLDLSSALNSAYKSYKLDKDMNEAQISLLKKQEEYYDSQIKNLDEDTKLKKYDKPLKVVGDILEGSNLPDLPAVKSVMAELVSPQLTDAKSSFKGFGHMLKSKFKRFASREYWDYVDTAHDLRNWANNNFPLDFIKYGYTPYKYFSGGHKYYRIRTKQYKRGDKPDYTYFGL